MLRVLPVLLVVALVIYLVIRFVLRHGEGGGGRGGVTPPTAPDDDPAFLRDLDTQLWEQQQRERRDQGREEPPAS